MLPIFEYVNIFVLFFNDATPSTLNGIMGADDFLCLMEYAGETRLLQVKPINRSIEQS